MMPDGYVIELNRLKYDDRVQVHYISRNENNQVSKDRWARINALEKAIIFCAKLLGEDKHWKDGNQFNSVADFWPEGCK
jgi:hypothetical protein